MSDVYEGMADKTADAFAIPRSLFRALIQTESDWNPFAIGRAGEIGLTQLMPTTASELGVNAWDAEQNLKGGATYLAQQFKRFGNWAAALAAYNGGPAGTEKQAAKDYAASVLKTQSELQKANPQLDQVKIEPPQDAWNGSVAQQIWHWIIGQDKDAPATPTQAPARPSGEYQYEIGPDGTPVKVPAKPSKGPTQQDIGASISNVGKYAAASIIAVIAIGIALYVLAVRGKDTATQVVKKNVA